VNLTFRPKKLLVTPGRRHRLILERHFRHGLRLVLRITDSNLPTHLSRRRSQRINTTPRRRYQRGGYAVLAQHVHHPIDRISFADPAGIQFHTRPRKTDRSTRGVEQDIAVTDLGQRPANLRPMRQMSSALVKSPDLHQRPDRDIESAL